MVEVQSSTQPPGSEKYCHGTEFGEQVTSNKQRMLELGHQV